MDNPPPAVANADVPEASLPPALPSVARSTLNGASAGAIVGELVKVPGINQIAAGVRGHALDAAASRSSFGVGGTPLEIDRAQAETPFGNACDLLEQGVTRDSGGRVLGALVAIGVANAPSDLGRADLAAQLVWLAAHTPVDPLSPLDAALGERAALLWRDVAQLAVDPSSERVEALTAAAALGASRSDASRAAAADASSHAGDPLLRSLLARDASGDATLAGQIAPPPRGPVLTALLAFTGILLVAHVVRLIGRYALGYKNNARVRLSERGLEIEQRIEMLGRVLSDRGALVPLDNLARVVREVRFPRAGMYAGLAALVLGSYLGLGLLVDGVRVPGGSPPLLGLGFLVIALGIGIDFALTSLSDSVRGRCRLVIEPRKGRRLCIGNLQPADADRMLALLAEKTQR